MVLEITADMTVNEVLARYPQAVSVLNEFGIDSCCGGAVPLWFAVQRDGVDLNRLIERLNAAAERT